MMKLHISEILNKLATFKGDGSNTAKAEWLQQNDSPTLRMMLKHGFDPNIAYNLPEGEPPFKKNTGEIDQTETNLFAEFRKLSYLWLVPSEAALTDLTVSQKEQMGPALAAQEAAGKDLLDTMAEAKAITARLRQAHEDITAAQGRLSAAQAEVAPMQQRIARVQERAKLVDEGVARMEAQMQQTNDQLLGRTSAPTAPNVPKYRLEMLFIQMLESLHPDEAAVLLAAKNKTMAKKYAITKDVVKKAFPTLL